MIPFRNSASFALAGALVTFALAGSTDASAGDDVAHPAPSVDRCGVYGPGFVDVGNGVCGRVSGHVRVDLGPSHAALNTWTAPNGTSTAGIRTDGAGMVAGSGMVPGAGAMQHLRVRNGLDSYDPFH